MARGDFIRQMPESARDFGRKPTLYERLHIDLPLLGILFALCVYGLVVLYSASGRQIATPESCATCASVRRYGASATCSFA